MPSRSLLPLNEQISGTHPEHQTFPKDPPTTAITSQLPVPALFATGANTESDDHTDPTRFRITKTQLEGLLGLALDARFTLEVVSDEDPASMTGDRSQGRVLGKIPVRLRVKELQIGGVSIPRLQTESVNAMMGAVNYGNIRA
ncbi:hypothetical protein BGZ72_005230 [Mortierella alpina]|nr:hypothetical protein BGZ72_005230 [Mortierella alpina]